MGSINLGLIPFRGIIETVADAIERRRKGVILTMADCLIARIENYKMNQVGGVGKEQEREEKYIQKYYDNPDHEPDKIKDNVTLYHDKERDGKTWEKYIKDYREEHGIEGRFVTTGKSEKSLTNVATQFMVTATPDYIKTMEKDEQIQFFKDSFEFLKQSYPTYHWVEVTVHFDEKTPHLHAMALPLYYDKDKDRTIFSTTKTQEGREHYREFQDRFYEYMAPRWHGLQRGERGSDREHLSVKDFKDLQEREKHLQQERQDLQNEKERFQQEKERYSAPPLKPTILGRKYRPEDVEKVVNERNAAYSEIDRLNGQIREIKGERDNISIAYGRLKDDFRHETAERNRLQDILKDPERTRQYQQEHQHQHEHERTVEKDR